MDKKIVDAVFKNYDIRGIADEQITEELAYAVGNALVQHLDAKTVLVGRDARVSSPKLTAAMVRGLSDAGAAVTVAGILSTPQIKWVVPQHGFDIGVMVSASHNPPQYNGFKIVLNGKPALGQASGLHDLKDYLESPKKAEVKGEVSEHAYTEEFVDSLLAVLPGSPVQVFVDPSGGVAAPELKLLMEKGDFNFVLYNAEIDPEFKVHPPNPMDAEALESAKEFCGMNGCLGVVLDADADRIVFVDEEGHPVPADFFGAWLASKMLSPGEAATGTVRDSRALKDWVVSHGGEFHLSSVGHANVQAVLMQHDLTLGIEKSGHIFFKQSHYGENTLLCLLLTLKYLGDGTLADAVREIRETYHCADEHNYRVTDKQGVLDAFASHFSEFDINTMDGVLVEGKDWWLNVRPSNTEPLMRLTWEAKDQEKYKQLQEDAETLLEPFLDAS